MDHAGSGQVLPIIVMDLDINPTLTATGKDTPSVSVSSQHNRSTKSLALARARPAMDVAKQATIRGTAPKQRMLVEQEGY